mmetsp:Transcript_27070/g.69663  ORF Transcript_27070/g.69663 Transcript_27070/m.69663 type:complete len:176 (+) Transcript_27070:336-863(+)
MDIAHIVGHSMGGVVATSMVLHMDMPPSCLINMEGNLLSSDCGIISRTCTKTPAEVFDAGVRKRLILGEGGEDKASPIHLAWLEMAEKGLSGVFRCCAACLVEVCDSGKAWRDYTMAAERVRALYVSGENSQNTEVDKALSSQNMSHIVCAGVGHFLFVEEPQQCANAVLEFMLN